MKRSLFKLLQVALVGAVVTAPLPAKAACWDSVAVEAAMVRDLQSKLMVAALRCVKSQSDLLPEYNSFVERHRTALQTGNQRLRDHFAKGVDARTAANEYDRFAVRLANSYGAGTGDVSDCGRAKALAANALTVSGDFSDLARFAAENGGPQMIFADRCRIVIAAAK